MDCGIPFCHTGCPLGNLIPDWNDLVYRDRWQAAIDRLHATNNFPEFTGRLCPAPCEGACVLGINNDPVTIKAVEVSIIDRAFDEGWVTARAARGAHRQARRGRRVGAGGARGGGAAEPRRPLRSPSSSAPTASAGCCATASPSSSWRSGSSIGGCSCMAEEGVDVPDQRATSASTCRSTSCAAQFDAIVLAGGATRPRDLPVPGRELEGIHFAMEYLTLQNRRNEGDDDSPTTEFISGEGQARHHHRRRRHRRRLPRHGAPPGRGERSISSSCCRGRPTSAPTNNPWPLWPNIFRVSSAHEEGGERLYSIATEQFTRRRRRAA